MRKGKDLDPEPDPYLWLKDPGGPKTCGYCGSGPQHWYLRNRYYFAISRSTISYSNLQYQYGNCYFCGSIPTGNLTVYQPTCRVLIGWRYQHAAASCRYSTGNPSALHPRSRHQLLKPWLWIRTHWIRISSKPGSGFGSRVLMKIGKNTAEKNLSFFVIKNCNLLIPGLLSTSKLQEKPLALKREHPALQKNEIY